MKNYSFENHKFLYFSATLLMLLATLVVFFHFSSSENQQEIITKSVSSAEGYLNDTIPTNSISKVATPIHTEKEKPADLLKRKISFQWQVEGWNMFCSNLEPLLNSQERGKVAFKVKINEKGKLVALEVIDNLTTLSEESVQSFKTTLEMQLESCLERKNVKIEPISSGIVTFFVN
ncbi:MAG: hypothetical protein RMJ97_07900 [Raineya sp.]|nr:hypothetical protein [Raineya sp.]MDW8296794.1 hypothetical protein [Raineya sp.]